MLANLVWSGWVAVLSDDVTEPLPDRAQQAAAQCRAAGTGEGPSPATAAASAK